MRYACTDFAFRSKLLHARSCTNPEGSDSLSRINQVKTPVFRLRLLLGELNATRVEHLFKSLIALDERLEALGIIEIDGKMLFLPTEEGSHV